MARKLKFKYRYKPRFVSRYIKMFVVLAFLSRHFFGSEFKTMSLSFLGFFLVVLIMFLNRLKDQGSVFKEFDVFNTGFEFPKVGIFYDTRGYANYKDVKKIELVDDYLTINMKSGSFYEIPLKNVSYVGRLSFAKELMHYKEAYDNLRKERRRVNHRNRQAKRREHQEKKVA